jgi:hypothetical protein
MQRYLTGEITGTNDPNLINYLDNPTDDARPTDTGPQPSA